MDLQHRPSTRRPPLGDATRRVNNELPPTPSKLPSLPHHDRNKSDLPQVKAYRPPSPRRHSDYDTPKNLQEPTSSRLNPAHPRLAAITKEHGTVTNKRDSLVSTVSTDSSRVKRSIGPWRLGRTLGHGATARVRLAKHAVTGQRAACKIVVKGSTKMCQSTSLANIERAEALDPDFDEGLRRMPIGIEREVAIMKLIQHPNIMKLYDIWENRFEIYLVLEYVNNGELFDHIANSDNGLEEEEAVKLFRQMISGVGYCHSFNICHRDLKPENILLTKEMDIKIADFGMAALQQNPDHKLRTSCGSPHYAAPEVIKGSSYRGHQVDTWSLGVILYVCLSGQHPFDVTDKTLTKHEVMSLLLKKIRRGRYEMSSKFSEDAKDLIRRMMQFEPHKRILLKDVWRHPLLRKYEYLDNLASVPFPELPSAKHCPALRRSEIDKDLLRQLRSMWHVMTEEQLSLALMNDKQNEQKLFYGLLLEYRDQQLENYAPELDIAYSNSDYHHIRPRPMKKTFSTCQFPQARSHGHGRQVSKFTVVSNTADTVRSYDPFKASRPQHLSSHTSGYQAKITILNRPATIASGATTQNKRTTSSASSQGTAADCSRLLPPPPKLYASRSSLASSSTRSRISNPYVRATIGHKRGVSFQNLRKFSSGDHSKSVLYGKGLAAVPRHSNHTDVTDDGGSVLRPVQTPASTRYIRLRKTLPAPQPMVKVAKRGPTSQIWKEDVRHLSTSLAKDCDEAFNRISVYSDISEKSSIFGGGEAMQKLQRTSLNSRPLPEPPARTQSVKNELLEARKQAEMRKMYGNDGESPTLLRRRVSHIDRLIQRLSPTRSFSAPTDSKLAQSKRSLAPFEGDSTLTLAKRSLVPTEGDPRKPLEKRPLVPIKESHEKEITPLRAKELVMYRDRQRKVEAKTARIASAPEPRELQWDSFHDRYTRQDSLAKDTIRVVDDSTFALSPVKPPAPLVIRKKSSQLVPPPLKWETRPITQQQAAGLDLRQQYRAGAKNDAGLGLSKIDEAEKDSDEYEKASNASTVIRKGSSWFKRSSRSGEEFPETTINTSLLSQSSNGSVREPYSRPPNPDHEPLLLPMSAKKKSTKLGRWFKKRNSIPEMVVGVDDTFDDATSIQESIADRHHSHLGDPRSRQIAPRQNWLAKLFKVKPVSKHLCFCLPKRRARQEITKVLREWKRYGLQDIQVDKERNIVFGKVAAGNYFDLKQVSFAAEVMTVIEHGKKSKLSIARFTQESGAASSFNKVLETMETVLKSRGLLLNDERKKRRMIKTANAA